MKKEMFNKLVEKIKANPDLYSTHKVTIKEGLEVHTFGHICNTDLAEAKTLFKEKGYKGSDVYEQANILSYNRKLSNLYLVLLYNTDRDKISISVFESGYAYAGRKGRYYPLRKNIPMFAWTKHMYNLQPRGRIYKPSPRIQLGEIGLYGYFPSIGELVTKTFLQIDYRPTVNISYRYFAETKNDFEAIGNMFGIKVPKSLYKFNSNDVLTLYKTIQDVNQINKLCQFMTKDIGSMDLHQTISKMLFNDIQYYWLVRDYMIDNLTLKTKNVSLKVTSVKRWQDDHRKATAKRMLKGVPEIKVDQKYNNALKGLDYPYEMISTKNRLIQESIELGHCVATYANKINSGACAIFSVEYEGKRWTLEVISSDIQDKLVFMPIQFRGLHNAPAPDLIGKRVAEVLNNNSKGISKSYIGPRQMEVLELF